MSERLLIAVITCLKNTDRADVQRRTWVKDAALLGVDVRFFVGRPSNEQLFDTNVYECGDAISLPVADDYFSIRKKVQLMFGWAVQHGYTWILKTDDDALVIPRNISFPLDERYIGRFRGPSGTWREPQGGATGMELYGHEEKPFCSGLGYMLRADAAACVALAPDNNDWAEDRFTGQVLAKYGIKPKMDFRYIFWPYDLGRAEYYTKDVEPQAIVACQHGYKEGLVERLYNTFNATGRLPRQ